MSFLKNEIIKDELIKEFEGIFYNSNGKISFDENKKNELIAKKLNYNSYDVDYYNSIVFDYLTDKDNNNATTVVFKCDVLCDIYLNLADECVFKKRVDTFKEILNEKGFNDLSDIDLIFNNQKNRSALNIVNGDLTNNETSLIIYERLNNKESLYNLFNKISCKTSIEENEKLKCISYIGDKKDYKIVVSFNNNVEMCEFKDGCRALDLKQKLDENMEDVINLKIDLSAINEIKSTKNNSFDCDDDLGVSFKI